MEERERRTAMQRLMPSLKGSGSARDRVAALAAALCPQHKEMSHDDAINRVLQRNPDLARAYQNELKA